MNPRRLKLVTILTGAALGALTLAAWTQPWFSLILDSGRTLSATGQVAAPALSALGLASLALAAALSIAGRPVRIVLGLLQLAIGVLVVISAVAAVADPIESAIKTITDAVGESGAAAAAALVASVRSSGWPWVTIALGVLLALVGGIVLITTRNWPAPTSRYETNSALDESTAGSWDALSAGADPTAVRVPPPGYNFGQDDEMGAR